MRKFFLTGIRTTIDMIIKYDYQFVYHRHVNLPGLWFYQSMPGIAEKLFILQELFYNIL